MTIAEAITSAAGELQGAGVPDARRDAELLLRHVLDKDRAWLLAHLRDPLNDPEGRFAAAVGRRAAREPVQYIIGVQEFRGLDFIVTPDVLIPRPETEFVVEAAVEQLQGARSPLILDLCTGSGCIAVSLAHELPQARIIAVDLSAAALVIARRNARAHGVADRIRFLEGDLFEPLAELSLRGEFDILVSNPPYVRNDELPALQPEVRDHEPKLALIAGTEGTEVSHRIIASAPDYLKRGAALVLEMGFGQAARLADMLLKTGRYNAPRVIKDLAGIDRVIAASVK